MRHIISILIEDKFGALARIVDLFSSRGFNLDSICSGESEIPNAQRLTLVTRGDEAVVRQIIKLLEKIVYVFEVKEIPVANSISRELMLVNMKITKENRRELLILLDAYEAKLIEMNSAKLSFQVIGSAAKLDGFTEVLREYEVIEISRTGEAAIHK